MVLLGLQRDGVLKDVGCFFFFFLADFELYENLRTSFHNILVMLQDWFKNILEI